VGVRDRLPGALQAQHMHGQGRGHACDSLSSFTPSPAGDPTHRSRSRNSRSEPNTLGGRAGVARRLVTCMAIARAAGAKRGARARVRVGARGSAQAHGPVGVDAALVVVWRVRVVRRRVGVLVCVSVACGVQALCAAALRVRLPSFDGVFGRRDRMRLLVVVCGVWDTGEGHAVDVRSADCREHCACVRCK
jgi:hypothetical protein